MCSSTSLLLLARGLLPSDRSLRDRCFVPPASCISILVLLAIHSIHLRLIGLVGSALLWERDREGHEPNWPTTDRLSTLLHLALMWAADAEHPSLEPSSLSSTQLPPANAANTGPQPLDHSPRPAGDRLGASAGDVLGQCVPYSAGCQADGITCGDLGRGVVAKGVSGVSFDQGLHSSMPH